MPGRRSIAEYLKQQAVDAYIAAADTRTFASVAFEYKISKNTLQRSFKQYVTTGSYARKQTIALRGRPRILDDDLIPVSLSLPYISWYWWSQLVLTMIRERSGIFLCEIATRLLNEYKVVCSLSTVYRMLQRISFTHKQVIIGELCIYWCIDTLHSLTALWDLSNALHGRDTGLQARAAHILQWKCGEQAFFVETLGMGTKRQSNLRR